MHENPEIKHCDADSVYRQEIWRHLYMQLVSEKISAWPDSWTEAVIFQDYNSFGLTTGSTAQSLLSEYYNLLQGCE